MSIPRITFQDANSDGDYSTKIDDGTLFLGEGSLAGVPSVKLAQKGIRPVIKVVDDKCL